MSRKWKPRNTLNSTVRPNPTLFVVVPKMMLLSAPIYPTVLHGPCLRKSMLSQPAALDNRGASRVKTASAMPRYHTSLPRSFYHTFTFTRPVLTTGKTGPWTPGPWHLSPLPSCCRTLNSGLIVSGHEQVLEDSLDPDEEVVLRVEVVRQRN